MVNRPTPRELRITLRSTEKLEERGLSFDDALAVFERDPEWVWQKPEPRVDNDLIEGFQPGRWRMIGRGGDGRVIMFLVTPANVDGVSWVVTGYEAPGRDRARYNQRRRRGM